MMRLSLGARSGLCEHSAATAPEGRWDSPSTFSKKIPTKMRFCVESIEGLRHAKKTHCRGSRIKSFLAVLVVSLLSFSRASLANPQVQTTEAVTKNPDTTRCYAVQVGAYNKRAEALAMLNRLTQKFSYPTVLTSLVTQDDTLWRVRMLTTSMTEALKASEHLLHEQSIRAW